MRSKTQKEDPQAKADRERDRRLAELDRTRSAQEAAEDHTTDLRAVYGLESLARFGRPGTGRSAGGSKSKSSGRKTSIFSMSQGQNDRRNSSDRDRS